MVKVSRQPPCEAVARHFRLVRQMNARVTFWSWSKRMRTFGLVHIVVINADECHVALTTQRNAARQAQLNNESFNLFFAARVVRDVHHNVTILLRGKERDL